MVFFNIKKSKILRSSPNTKRNRKISKVPENFHIRTSCRIKIIQSGKSEEPTSFSKLNAGPVHQRKSSPGVWMNWSRNVSIKEIILLQTRNVFSTELLSNWLDNMIAISFAGLTQHQQLRSICCWQALEATLGTKRNRTDNSYFDKLICQLRKQNPSST